MAGESAGTDVVGAGAGDGSDGGGPGAAQAGRSASGERSGPGATRSVERAYAGGAALTSEGGTLGELRPTSPTSSVSCLEARLADDGYLYLPGLLAASEVWAARVDVLDRLVRLGVAAAGSDPARPRPGPEAHRALFADVAAESDPLRQLLYAEDSPLARLFERVFGGPVRHFDYTWLRALAPGGRTAPHMDSVFMNRGTWRLLTAWVPLGDVDPALGGLAVLEGSPRLLELRQTYGRRDVDAYCDDDPAADDLARQERMVWNGALPDDPVTLVARHGGRWLTADFHAGDVVVFPIWTVHLGLDNTTDALRLSCDLRYQPADEPADPRWVGPEPSAHGARSKRAVIC